MRVGLQGGEAAIGLLNEALLVWLAERVTAAPSAPLTDVLAEAIVEYERQASRIRPIRLSVWPRRSWRMSDRQAGAACLVFAWIGKQGLGRPIRPSVCLSVTPPRDCRAPSRSASASRASGE
jgi:hypothetical protein